MSDSVACPLAGSNGSDAAKNWFAVFTVSRHEKRVEAHLRLRCGVMAGMEGVLLRKRNKFWVVVALEMIMRSVTVELEIKDIEPVGRVSCASAFQLAAGA